MADTWEDIRRRAKKQTDEAFAARISSLTRLTDDEVRALAPTPADRARLAELLGLVQDTTRSNQEKAEAIRSVAGLAEMVVPLLTKLI